MTLKILYSLDNGSTGTYLARSKKPQIVRIANIPNPDSTADNDSSPFKIGAVDLSLVLQEIYVNSPELLNHNASKTGYDYNLYYKDICELDEPLVSLGLLSQIRHKMDKGPAHDAYQYDDSEEEESYIVTGRVCSNFAALLKRSYSSTGSMKQRKSCTTAFDTLEVKLRFIGVVNPQGSRRPSTNSAVLPKVPVPTLPSNQVNFKNMIGASKIVRPVKTSNSTKRQTNPTPAPKAERTQSLPIWSLKQGTNNTGLPTNSIAHRIFLADRKTESAQAKSSYQQAATYQINALQQDNTVQKFRVDDSVSKRFDFMLNKKKKQQNQQQRLNSISSQQAESHKVNGPNKRSSVVMKARRFNTMAAIPTPLMDTRPVTKTDLKQKARAGSISGAFSELIQEQVSGYQHLLTGTPEIQRESLELLECNKENLPPQNIPTDGIDLDLLNFADVGLKSDLDWFGNYDPFNSPSVMPDVLADNASKPASTTPKDPNTCNTIDIENLENVEKEDSTPTMQENRKIDSISDADRTSPIDTLSMPLMELNDRSTTRMVSCQEQLRRLPLLGHQLKGNAVANTDAPKNELDAGSDEDGNNEEEDATSVVMQYSSSYADGSLPSKKDGLEKKRTISECSSPLLKRQHDSDDQEACKDDEEQKQNLKKQRIMPSSPTMFNYPDDTSSTGDANDLFSSFITGQHGHNQDADSTPATQYQHQSSDHTKN